MNQRGKLLHNKKDEVSYNVCIHTFLSLGGDESTADESIAERNVSVGDNNEQTGYLLYY